MVTVEGCELPALLLGTLTFPAGKPARAPKAMLRKESRKGNNIMEDVGKEKANESDSNREI